MEEAICLLQALRLLVVMCPPKQQPTAVASDGHHRADDDAPPAGHCPAWCFPWLTAAGFAFLTFNSVMAVRRARGDRGAVAFCSYLDLLALFICLRWYDGARPGSPLRGRLRAAVWLLTSALTVLFSSRVAVVMPGAAVAVVVWLLAFGTVAGGFYALFLCGNDGKQSNVLG